MTRALGLTLLAAVLTLAACGDDGASAKADMPPSVGDPIIECGSYSGEGNLGDYDGDVIVSLVVEVTDPDGDLSYVDATIDGAVFRLTPDAEGTVWAYEQAGATNLIARCMTGTTAEIRAVDATGLVTTRDVTIE